MNSSDAGRNRSSYGTAGRAALGAGLLALFGLTWPGGDGAIATVEAATDCTLRAPGAGDYCASNLCGPCLLGEGDCDPGQCGPGLECVEEGGTDRCRAVADTCGSTPPGAMDYCATNRCGPCGEGEGDCDPGQCGAGLTCAEEGGVDHCRAPVDACSGALGDLDYCATDRCGPCGEGEGDCDPGQCASGFECVEEGAVDHCRPVADGCSAATPGAMDYCATNRCGPCGEGEGDCDPGQCGSGLECVEEGGVDHCRTVGSGGGGTSNLQVRLDGAWNPVCCDGGIPEVSDRDCWWTEYDRTLTDTAVGLKLFCPEGNPANCTCGSWGERMHGANGSLDSSVGLPEGGPVYPNFGEETCVYITSSGRLATEWTNSGCPNFRLLR
jgi:hypothetical protein